MTRKSRLCASWTRPWIWRPSSSASMRPAWACSWLDLLTPPVLPLCGHRALLAAEPRDPPPPHDPHGDDGGGGHSTHGFSMVHLDKYICRRTTACHGDTPDTPRRASGSRRTRSSPAFRCPGRSTPQTDFQCRRIGGTASGLCRCGSGHGCPRQACNGKPSCDFLTAYWNHTILLCIHHERYPAAPTKTGRLAGRKTPHLLRAPLGVCAEDCAIHGACKARRRDRSTGEHGLGCHQMVCCLTLKLLALPPMHASAMKKHPIFSSRQPAYSKAPHTSHSSPEAPCACRSRRSAPCR